MKWEGIKFTFKHLFRISSWRCNLRYMRGVSRLADKRYEESFLDFQWTLENCESLAINNLVYKHLGIIRARQEKFDEAEKYLLEASALRKAEKDGELLMWLGYIYLVKRSYSESLECFKKAQDYGQKGINKWLIEKEYIQQNIKDLDKVISKTI